MKKTHTSCSIKLSAKVKDIKEITLNPQKTFFLEQNPKIKNLIFQLTNVLKAQDKDDENIEVMTTQTREEKELGYENPLKILVTKINLANATYHKQFVCFT